MRATCYAGAADCEGMQDLQYQDRTNGKLSDNAAVPSRPWPVSGLCICGISAVHCTRSSACLQSRKAAIALTGLIKTVVATQERSCFTLTDSPRLSPHFWPSRLSNLALWQSIKLEDSLYSR